jgi:Cytochrome c7 and related cytochrome c
MRADKLVGRRRYFRRLSWMEAACVWLIAGSAALVAAWFLISMAIRPDPSRYSPGELSQVHSAWEHDCDACHRPSSPKSASILSEPSVRWRDFTCEKCHGEALHTEFSKDYAESKEHHAPDQHCADCHLDHGGKMKSLVAMGDAACTRCHANLPGHATETPKVAATVTDFFSGHPEFKKLEQAPRRKLTFSHSLHLTPGTWYGTGKEIGKVTDRAQKLSDIPESFREQYRQPGQKDDDLVQLNCQSCHQLTGSSPQSVRGTGMFMAPMKFERDCKACHDLKTIAVGDDKFQHALYPQHGVQPEALSDWLTSEITLAVFKDQTKSTDVKLFGGRLDPLERTKIEATLKPRVESLVADAKKNLTGSEGICAKCHTIDDKTIVPPDIPTVWFQKAWFDHASHRALNCAECHDKQKSNVNKEGVTQLGVPESLGIPSIKLCRECHGPKSAGKAGVRAGCVDCHRYHNGDHPLLGRGAAAFDPPEKLTISKWIQGR